MSVDYRKVHPSGYALITNTVYEVDDKVDK